MAKQKQVEPWTQAEIPFPLEGVDLTRALHRQRPNTTVEGINVRAFDPVTNRARGGSRRGFAKYFPTQVAGDAFPVQDINHLVTSVSQSTTAVGQFVYARTSGNGFGVGSSAGASIFTAGNVASNVFDCSCWDNSGLVYVAERNTATGVTTIYKYNVSGTQQWTQTFTAGTGAGRRIVGMAVAGDSLYVLWINTASTAWAINKFITATGAQTASWRTNTNTTNLQASTGAVNCLAAIGNILGVDTKQNVFLIIDTTKAITVAPISVAYSLTGSASARSAVVSDGNTFFYTIPSVTTSVVKQISVGGTVGWTVTPGGTLRDLAYDMNSQRLYVVKTTTTSMLKLSLTNGATEVGYDPASVTNWDNIDCDNNGFITLWRNSNASNDVMGTNTTGATIWGPSTFANVVHDGASVNRQPPASPTASGAARLVQGLAMANGSLYQFNTTGPTLVGGGWSAAAPVIYSAQLGTNLFFADGTVYRYYNSTTRAAAAWVPSAGSAITTDASNRPATLIERWNGRIVLAGFISDPQLWAMSAQSNAFDWNFAPINTNFTQAMIGTNADGPGLPGDFITCIIPYRSDILILGCANSIFQLNGDPAAGGVFSQVSSTIGMASGRPYAVDGSGQVVYFWSSHLGIYKMSPGGIPVPASQSIINELLKVNLATNVIRMVWDVPNQGLAVWVTPTDRMQPTTHFFWEERTNAWWMDEYATVGNNPMAVHLFDGDTATDRSILIGGGDGYVYLMNNDATTDDGDPIESSVMIGPYPQRYLDDILLNDLHALLAIDSGPVNYAVYVGDSPEQALASSAVASGTWTPSATSGRQHSTLVYRAGASIYIKLSSSNGWAIEKIGARYRALPGPRTRW